MTIRDELNNRFKKHISMHKAKEGFNLIIFDGKEDEVISFLKSKSIKIIVEKETGTNWQNRAWIEYYVEIY